MRPLPSREADADEVAAWVRSAMIALDDTPRERMWRWRALGGNYGDAVAGAPGMARLGIRITLDEKRLLSRIAADRGLPMETYVRRLLGTAIVAVDRVDPDALPFILNGGMIRP